MRLEVRRVISLGEIINEPLEITVCRLSWNEPVSNDNFARHKEADGLLVKAGGPPAKMKPMKLARSPQQLMMFLTKKPSKSGARFFLHDIF